VKGGDEEADVVDLLSGVGKSISLSLVPSLSHPSPFSLDLRRTYISIETGAFKVRLRRIVIVVDVIAAEGEESGEDPSFSPSISVCVVLYYTPLGTDATVNEEREFLPLSRC